VFPIAAMQQPPIRQGMTMGCIPISYATALGSIVKQSAHDVLRELGVVLGATVATAGVVGLVTIDEIARSMNIADARLVGPVPGAVSAFDLLAKFHSTAPTPITKSAHNQLTLSRSTDMMAVELWLTRDRALAVVAVDFPASARLAHAVVVGRDATHGFFVRDSNASGQTLSDGMGTSIEAAVRSISDLKDCRIGDMIVLTGIDVHSQLLSAAGFERARAAVADRYAFLVHRARLSSLPSIRAIGLRPALQPTAGDVKLSVISSALGGVLPPILCLSPPEHRITFTAAFESVELAVVAKELPQRIGVDWSCGSTWTRVEQFWEDAPTGGLEGAVFAGVDFCKSVISYDAIPPASLRIRLKESAADATTWPRLTDATDGNALYVRGSSAQSSNT
jgi:hypothetical protein